MGFTFQQRPFKISRLPAGINRFTAAMFNDDTCYLRQEGYGSIVTVGLNQVEVVAENTQI